MTAQTDDRFPVGTISTTMPNGLLEIDLRIYATVSIGSSERPIDTPILEIQRPRRDWLDRQYRRPRNRRNRS